MSPHSNAPVSPTGSFTQHFSSSSLRSARPSALRSTNAIYEDSQYSSSFDSTSPMPTPDGNVSRPLLPGVYVPTACFFHPTTEDLDLATIATHAVRLAKAGVKGLTTQGSNGEAVHLTPEERNIVTSTTRRALEEAGYGHMPIIVGCGAQSTREAIALCHDAYKAGGDYALVLPPSYYSGLFAPNSKTIIEFFTTLADVSPIPLIIYNYPGAVSGIDLNSDVIIELSKHENIKGVKLTCGNTGKLNRIVTGTREDTKTCLTEAPDFLVLGGSADFTMQSLIGGGHGILAGLANIAPKTCVKIFELYKAGKLAEAQALQEEAARGDWGVIQGGVVGTKAAMEGSFGYGGYARSPLPKPNAQETAMWAAKLRGVVLLEKTL